MKVIKAGLLAVCAVSLASAAPTTETKEKTAEVAGGDPVEFVATVNRSYAKSDEPLDDRRKETLYGVNRDAVRGAKGADQKVVLAEVFATVPKDCLPMITDRFAAEIFSRKASGLDKDDESFVDFASSALMKISGRLRTADDYPGTRSAFAVIMFLKASEGKPSSLREDLMVYVLSGSHKIAREEWIPAALGDDGKAPTYAPIMEAGIRGEEPNHRLVLSMGAPEELNRMVGSDMRVGKAWDVSGSVAGSFESGFPGDDGTGTGIGSGLWRIPHRPVAEPRPYSGQSR